MGEPTFLKPPKAKKRVLFAVHRYYPYPGGSEIYVHNMARALLEDGLWKYDYEVAVVTEAGGNKGDIKLSSGKVIKAFDVTDPNFKIQEYDLVVIHGGDVGLQNLFHEAVVNCNRLPPMLYMIIKPPHSKICHDAALKHRFIGWSTLEDHEWLNSLNVPANRRIYMPHGIPILESRGSPSTFLETNLGANLPKGPIFVSAGGFWAHKGFDDLVNSYVKVRSEYKYPTNMSLLLYGYSDHPTPYDKLKHLGIHVIKKPTHKEIMDAMAVADAYIMNSTEEGFGLVLLEAALNMTNVIATNIAGAKILPFIKRYPVGDSELLENHMKWVIDTTANEPNSYERMLDRQGDKVLQDAKTWVKTHHSIENTVQSIDEVLRQLTEGRPSI